MSYSLIPDAMNRLPNAQCLGRLGAILVAMFLLATPAFATAGPNLNRAGQELGFRMLRPYMATKVGNSYVATVKNPAPLARLGLEDLAPGDRVICRITGKHRFVISNGSGNHTAPIELAASGAISKAETVPRLNPHVNVSPRERKRRRRSR